MDEVLTLLCPWVKMNGHNLKASAGLLVTSRGMLVTLREMLVIMTGILETLRDSCPSLHTTSTLASVQDR